MAQNYPEDYDGVFSQVPVINLTSLTLWGTVFAQQQTTADTWIPPTKQVIIENGVLRQCDALDGSAHGVISHCERCNQMFINQPATTTAWSRICCASGTDEGASCLSDGQIKTLITMHSEINFGYELGYGNPGYAAFGVGPSGQTWLGERTMPTASYAGGLFSIYWKSLLTGNPSCPQMTWNPTNFKTQFVATSTALDALNPDLSKFLARDGKLILKTNSGDQTSNYRETIAYYKRLHASMWHQAKGIRCPTTPCNEVPMATRSRRRWTWSTFLTSGCPGVRSPRTRTGHLRGLPEPQAVGPQGALAGALSGRIFP